MELGLIGLGKMGFNMAERLRQGGHKVVGFDFNAEAVGNSLLRVRWACNRSMTW